MQTPDILQAITDNVEKVIIGKRHVIELMIITLVAKGHVLIEDLPGVGKTQLAAALARSFNCSFSRIQFTTDVLPSDIMGFSMYNQKTREFEFKKGTIMSSFVLADEINRTSPKTQASLLEAMEEQQVTVDGVTYAMESPFIVIATQNPVEYVGTFPLPEAQLDRFMIRIAIGYPTHEQEIEMLERYKYVSPLETLKPVASARDIINMQQAAEDVHIDDKLSDYIVKLTNATRNHEGLLLGASPRASLNLMKMAQSRAFFRGRKHVLPEDIVEMAVPVLSHRLRIKQELVLRGITQKEIVDDLLKKVQFPLFRNLS
ncbi:MAG: MoxR family ATPase [Oscillospiraceae bacterium]|nr:MoxR family ATPase [Oscillospiraceae bacterium]